MIFQEVIGMIRHLNPEGFRQFGAVLTDRRSLLSKPNHHSVYLPEGTVSDYRTVAPIWLGPEAGLAILSLSLDGEMFADFYLDKAVQLKGGIWFRLTGFGGKASLQMSGSSMPQMLGQRINDRDFAVRPKVRVECLYTLFYQEKEAGFFFPGESHPMAELLYVDNGRMHSVADGQDIPLEQGDLVIYGPGQWHMQYAQPDQAPRMVTVGFWARGVQWETLCNRRFRPDRESVSLLQKMLAAQQQDDPDRIFSLLTLLLQNLQEQGNRQEAGLQVGISGENVIISKAQQYVREHVTEKLTVPVVAERVGVSASYLSTIFKQETGKTFVDYVNGKRVDMAKHLLKTTRLQIQTVAQHCGFVDAQYFSKVFKKYTGQTPREYCDTRRN